MKRKYNLEAGTVLISTRRIKHLSNGASVYEGKCRRRPISRFMKWWLPMWRSRRCGDGSGS